MGVIHHAERRIARGEGRWGKAEEKKERECLGELRGI